ncbi:DUF6639 family protein [Maliponia aquimaris]|uniref:Plant Basic Secretory Protein n=1 Tax=Maliponia aquimaris TaxID=1673631 RepID=A0A238KQT2_9RHOB|nr:DUF6639 family protein [Maliponia aquimaris]SMX45135.1 hypothetical protein MAA8898_03151 [Maliponia aquimaris]
MARRPGLTGVTAGLVLAALWWGPGTAQHPCDNGLVTVRSEYPNLVGQVCDAADRAFDIFADCGAGLPDTVVVRTEQEILGNCLGLFHCGKVIVEVLTPEAIRDTVEPDGLYGHIAPDEMFESIVIHELTHALYDGTPCTAEFTECFVTSEYLAYALQFEALSQEARAPWLEQFDPQVPVSRDAISLGMLMLRNDDFALSAWAHLTQREDRCDWINGILDGDIVFTRPQY